MAFLKRPRPPARQTSSSGTSSAPADFLNLIFFGETGVGKSTLINTFANFLAYSTFEDADKNEVKCVIPCDFNVANKDYKVTNVQCGKQDENESKGQPAGKSVTQTVKSYFFDIQVKGQVRKLHIIDTPGVGDTQGIVKDKENFQKVIDYIKQYDGLNAICILLKPNDSRLTLQFRYCFKELLVQLNRGAAPNICFCYTNARSTFFRPGEGYPLLIENIKEIEKNDNIKIPLDLSNTFCFDSEPFRYLAAKNQNVEFDPIEIPSFKESWVKGHEALYRLIAHAADLSPAAVKPIYVLNQARKMLMDLSKPVAELSRNIQANKKLAEDKMKELENLTDDGTPLEDKLYVDQIDVKTTMRTDPKTVCFNQKCTKLVKLGESQTIIYESNCHVPCALEGIPTDVVGQAVLKNCAAFEGGKTDDCVVCGHHWQEHMHTLKEFTEDLVQVLDPNIQMMIDQRKDKKEIVENAIKSAEQMVKDCEAEQELIIKASAKLANYIKKSGIIYYNPDLEEYMNLLIQEEEQKKQAGGTNSSVLDGLKKARDNFYAEMAILNKSLKPSDEILTENDIQKLVDDMRGMKMFGGKLASMMEPSTAGAK